MIVCVLWWAYIQFWSNASEKEDVSAKREADWSFQKPKVPETKLTDQITVNMRVDGQEMWYPLVSWGAHWYESNNQWEVILEEGDDIEFHIESLVQGTVKTEKISLERLPKRAEYSIRLQIETMFLDEKTCKITVRDVGFGDFFLPTDFREEKVIHLGGNDGKFNSLS